MGRHVKITPDMIKRMIKRYQDGVSVRAIAKAFGTTDQTVSKIIQGSKNAPAN